MEELQGQFDAKAIENQIRSYYLDNTTMDAKTLVENREEEDLVDKNNNLISYIEGPPTMNGEPHVGHLRGRIIKDLWYRFNTLQKKKVICRAGWDTQEVKLRISTKLEWKKL